MTYDEWKARDDTPQPEPTSWCEQCQHDDCGCPCCTDPAECDGDCERPDLHEGLSEVVFMIAGRTRDEWRTDLLRLRPQSTADQVDALLTAAFRPDEALVLREERNQAEEQERDLAADVRDLKAVLGDCERFMSALVEMWRNDMAGDQERGMARFNSGGFVETIRAAREALK